MTTEQAIVMGLAVQAVLNLGFLDMTLTAWMARPASLLLVPCTYPSETNQVLELSPVYKILTINATLDCEFFSFCKQTASPEPTICHAAV